MNRAKKQAGITDIIQPKVSKTSASTSQSQNVVKFEKVGDLSLGQQHSNRPKKRIFNSLQQEQQHRSSDYSKRSDQPTDRPRYQHPLKTRARDFDAPPERYDPWAPTPLKVVERSSVTKGTDQWTYTATTTTTTPAPPPPPSLSGSPSSPLPPPSPSKSRLYDRLARMSQQKAAGMNERLIKPVKEFTQPDNPHMVKVAVIGAPNAGKSTLVNKLIGEEVSSCTDVPRILDRRALIRCLF